MSDEPAPNERGLLLRRIAHEVLSPTGVAWGALDEIETEIGDDMKPMVAMGRRALSRLRRLARRLSMTAELESGPPRLERVATDLGELVGRALEEAKVIDGRRQVEVTVDAPDHGTEVVVDGRWLEVAFAELASNAIRFARTRAHVKIAVDGGRLVATFEDDGDGFGTASPRALADRFATRPEVRGLGLSLGLAFDVAESHGGSLDVCDSSLPTKVGKGACLRLELPLGGEPAGGGA